MFAPALILTLALSKDVTGQRSQQVQKWLLALVIAVVLGGFIAAALGIDLFRRNLLPLVPATPQSQGIITVRHALNLLNWLFLSALPFLVLMPAVAAWPTTKGTNHSNSALFATWLIIPAVLFMVLFRPQLGAPRDWDLFSLPAFVLIPSSLILCRARCGGSLPRQLVPAAVVSLCLTTAFVGVNSSVTKAVDRFAEVIEVAKPRNLYQEYALLFNHSENHPELRSRQMQFALKAWAQPARNRTDSLYLGTKIAQRLMASGDQSGARGFIAAVMQADSSDINNYVLLQQYYERFGKQQELLRLAHEIERRFPNSARGQMEAGVIWLKQGRTEPGGHCLEKAFRLDSMNTLIIVNLGNYALLSERYPEAADLFARAIAIDSSLFAAHFGRASAFYYDGDMARAREHLNDAARLAASEADHRKLGNLRSLLDDGQ
jgi:Flp pilus assembly protein TadD